MRRAHLKFAAAIAGVAVLGVGTVAVASDSHSRIEEDLSGFEEVPALSTPGVGEFRARVNGAGTEIRYRLTFSDLETNVTQSHIHFENETNNGAIVVFLCSSLPTAPPGVQPCPAGNGGTVTGTLDADDVGDLAAGQGIAAGEFAEFVRAIRAGSTYVNVHSVGRPGGEIRAQLGDDHHHDHD